MWPCLVCLCSTLKAFLSDRFHPDFAGMSSSWRVLAAFGLGTLMPKYSQELAKTLEERKGLLKQYLQLAQLDTDSATRDRSWFVGADTQSAAEQVLRGFGFSNLGGS